MNFIIPFGFSVLGLWAFLMLPGPYGILAFVGLFLIGSCVGTYFFKRYATLEQIKADLEARLQND